jgi:uncharacterized protein YdiU (UPF0061 family)
MRIVLDTFQKELEPDKNTILRPRQVREASYSYVKPRIPTAPSLLHVSEALLQTLGIDEAQVKSEAFLNLVSGADIPPPAQPYSMVYSGHQFGHWAGQLGDGRAINLGAVRDSTDLEWILQLKGAGLTPYSRSADGLAVLRSSIREHLCSEAMYHLGVPTTRSLSLALTGDQVLRDMMYDGNAAYEQGAVVCRVAPSFIRFGNLQHHMANKEYDLLQRLADYVIDHHTDIKASGKDRYLALFDWVVDRTIDMVVHWQRVGFVHGVMNTDNMSILGLTIDYGPYGWLDDYDTEWTPNTTDRQGRRYRFGHQPQIAAWNLVQLANALYPLVGEAAPFEAILQDYGQRFGQRYLRMMHDKLGFGKMTDDTVSMIQGMDQQLMLTETDMTIFYQEIGHTDFLSLNDEDALERVSKAFYLEDIDTTILDKWTKWLQKYRSISSSDHDSVDSRSATMQAANPRYVLRNYMAQLAIDAANEGDYSLITDLYTMLQQPYTYQEKYEKWYQRRPDWARHKVGCSMLSCSS